MPMVILGMIGVIAFIAVFLTVIYFLFLRAARRHEQLLAAKAPLFDV